MQHSAVSACPLKYSLRICEFWLSPVADADRRDAAKALTSPCRAKPRAAKKRMTQQLLKHDRPHRQPTNDGEDLQVQGPVPPDPLVRARQFRITRIDIRTRRLDVVI